MIISYELECRVTKFACTTLVLIFHVLQVYNCSKVSFVLFPLFLNYVMFLYTFISTEFRLINADRCSTEFSN